MKERFDDPSFYDHVFYPRLWKLVLPILLTPVALGVFSLIKYLTEGSKFDYKLIWISAGIATVLGIPIFIFRILEVKRLQVGIGSAGVYLRGYGFLPWAEIKTISMGSDSDGREQIEIVTYDAPETNFEKSSWFKKTIRHVSPSNMYIIHGKDFISIPLKELADLLQQYHAKYKGEVAQHAQIYQKTGTDTEKIKDKDEKSRIKGIVAQSWITGGSGVLMSAFFLVFAFIKKDKAMAVAALGFLALSVAFFFKTSRFIFSLFLSVIFILGVPGAFLYLIFWEKKFELSNFIVVVFYVVYGVFIMLIAVRRWKKKQG